MKDLTVEIPLRFKKKLSQRFDLRRAKRDYSIGASPCEIATSPYKIAITCPLCEEFYKCKGCPFTKFEVINYDQRESYALYKLGCEVWMDDVLKMKREFSISVHAVRWSANKHKLARKQIKLLRKAAGKLITFKER